MNNIFLYNIFYSNQIWVCTLISSYIGSDDVNCNERRRSECEIDCGIVDVLKVLLGERERGTSTEWVCTSRGDFWDVVLLSIIPKDTANDEGTIDRRQSLWSTCCKDLFWDCKMEDDERGVSDSEDNSVLICWW